MIVFSNATRNMAGALVTRVVSMAVAIFSVPILLNLLGTELYGTWVTLTALIAFIGMMDLGVGNSVRNSVASVVGGESAVATRQEFVAFFRMLCGVAVVALVLLGSALSWFPLLRQNQSAAMLLYGPLLLLLPLLLGSSVLQGARAVGLQSLLQSASGWLFFVFIGVCQLARWTPDLADLATAWSGFYALAVVTMFLLSLRVLKLPATRLVSLRTGGLPISRLKVGVSFLLLQLSALTLYSLGNAIIYHELGAVEVARYDVLNKIFQVELGFYTIVIGVMWSEIARLRALGDFAALRRVYRKMTLVALLFCTGVFVAAIFTPALVSTWTKHALAVHGREALAAAVLVSLQALAYVGAVFMNAFEQIKEQMILACVSVVLMLPLSRFLIHHGLGIAAIPVAASLLTLLPMIVCHVKAQSLISPLTALKERQ